MSEASPLELGQQPQPNPINEPCFGILMQQLRSSGQHERADQYEAKVKNVFHDALTVEEIHALSISQISAILDLAYEIVENGQIEAFQQSFADYISDLQSQGFDVKVGENYCHLL